MGEINELFRYSSQKHNDNLLNHGNLRVGTLYDFRKSEHKRGIADPTEGTKTVSHAITEWHQDAEIPGSPSIDQQAVDLSRLFGSGSGNSIKGITLVTPFDDRDCFVHCTSLKFGREVLEEFEDAETCVKISRPWFFYETLTKLINAEAMEVDPPLFGIVKYQSRSETFDPNHSYQSATMIKEEIFAPQFEFRAIWYPRDKRIMRVEPYIVTNDALKEFCTAAPL